jgi:hypothetical protein
MGKMDIGHEGDLYWIHGKNKGYTSFHKSKQVHIRDEYGKKTILNEKDSNKLFIGILQDIFEPFKEMNSPEIQFNMNLLNYVQSAFSYNGCFNPECTNRLGIAIRFDHLLELFIDFLNENREVFLQIGGPIENTFDPDEEEEVEEYSDPLTDIVFPKLKIEKIPYCKYCVGQRYIQYNNKKKRFYRYKCPRCVGLGLDMESLEKYRVNIKSST